MTKEAKIEQRLIEKLVGLKYVHRRDIRDRDALEQNFRQKFEDLNKVKLTDSEFSRLLAEIISNDVFTAANFLRQRNSFARDDGTPLHYTLVNIKNWCKNTFEVVNQLRINTRSSHQRYDVILLMNGVPVVQIELKAMEVSPRRAMTQIVDYRNVPGNGYGNTLMCFMQLFIVSNQSNTWYFANNSNKHFKFDADERFLPVYQFAAKDNSKITHLDSFSERFLAKCTLSEMISRYMVLVASEQKLMMMRPYQIYAVQAIVDCIHQNRGNGYIWHTTGSGKTLTSFKASTLLKDNPDIDKCLFVVDRKDLDRQTREEFNRFQKGCVEENTNTAAMVRRLLSSDYADKVIVTTIQKLGLALDGKSSKKYKQRLEPLRNKRMVFIFDECHRSQFGDNHQSIKAFFPNAQLFGFTGTPIFEKNASYHKIDKIDKQEEPLKTTTDIFQKRLHAYTITHAIEDRNVLRFHVDYYKAEGKNNSKPDASLTQEAVAKAILEKHDKATAGRKFNAILATASINHAIEYYRLFKKLQEEQQKKLQEQSKAENITYRPLNIACVFSPPAEGSQDVRQLQEDLPQEKKDNQQEPKEKKAALSTIMADYNVQYDSNHHINEFDLYYQDVQKRIKDQQYSDGDLPHNQKIDVTIVVDMLLTGFDSKYLNTLYVDKNLKYHGLIQAFSRTNRVLNDSKPYGNILDFRQQEAAVDEAITLFSGEKTGKSKSIWLVEQAPTVIEKFQNSMNKLETFMASQGLENAPDQVANLKGDEARAGFINHFKQVQRLKMQLNQYTDLTEKDISRIEKIIPQEQLQAFRGVYIDVAKDLRAKQGKGDDPADPVEQLDFELVLFASVDIDYDYIMQLIAGLTEGTPEKQKMTRDALVGLISSDSKLIDQREDIIVYIDTLKAGVALSKAEIIAGFEAFKNRKLDRQLSEIAHKHGLEASPLQAFVKHVIDRTNLDNDGLSNLMTPLELGWKARGEKEDALVKDLAPLLHRLAEGREISGLKVYEQ